MELQYLLFYLGFPMIVGCRMLINPKQKESTCVTVHLKATCHHELILTKSAFQSKEVKKNKKTQQLERSCRFFPIVSLLRKWHTGSAVHSHSHSFSVVRCSTAQYSRCFIPASTKCWNDLPSGVVDCLELQKFKVGANKFLLDRWI